jgi:hypothetical protein
LFLEFLEDLLLFFGEAWWAWLWCPGGLGGAGGGEWAAEEAWAHGADCSGDWVHGVVVLEGVVQVEICCEVGCEDWMVVCDLT